MKVNQWPPDPMDLNLLLSGLFLLLWGIRLWPDVMIINFYGLISMLLSAAGLLFFGMGLIGTRRRSYRIPILVLYGIAFMAWAAARVLLSPSYGTDEISYDQWAAQLLVHGHNPYTQNLARALSHFHVPQTFYTYTISGQFIHQLSYPAMAIYPYLPLMFFGVVNQSAIATDMIFWIISILLFYFLLPQSYRWIALLFGTLNFYNVYVLGGVTDVLFFPFLFVAAYRWDHFDQGSGYWRWGPPIAFGLAASVKQTVWFIAPFLFLALILENRNNHRGWKTALRYTAIAVATFALVNGPFMVENFMAWMHGLLLPLTQLTIPAGQGFIGLSLFEQIGGGSLALFNDLGVIVLLAGLCSLFFYYKALKPLIFFMPSVVLFWASRSFASYLLDLLPFAILSALTTKQAMNTNSLSPKWQKSVLAGLAVIFGLVLSLIILQPSPLNLAVTHIHVVGERKAVNQIVVLVTNKTNRLVQPHFTLTTNGRTTSFWTASRTSLPPHHTVKVILLAPNEASMPPLDSNFIVDAFTTHPETLSTSALCHAWMINQ